MYHLSQTEPALVYRAFFIRDCFIENIFGLLVSKIYVTVFTWT